MELLRKYAADASPWFMAINFWEPHAPYLPTVDYKDRYDPAGIKKWINYRDDLKDKPALHRILRDSIFPGARDATWDVWARIISRYYAQAAMVDHEVGRIVDFLIKNGLYNETLIIFASDHGESIGVHGGAFDKGGMAYEEIYRIPFILKLPGNAHAGETRQSLVSLFDLAPTICESAEAPLAATDAASLWPVVEHGDSAGRDFLLSEDHGHRVPFGQRILWGERYKYVWNLSDRDELYDLEADPGELQNRVDDPSMRTVLSEFRQEMRKQVLSNGDRLGPQVTQMLG
jgi:arylsulfatase A-like enzyme